MGNRKGYSIKTTNGKYFGLSIDKKSGVDRSQIKFLIFSITVGYTG